MGTVEQWIMADMSKHCPELTHVFEGSQHGHYSSHTSLMVKSVEVKTSNKKKKKRRKSKKKKYAQQLQLQKELEVDIRTSFSGIKVEKKLKGGLEELLNELSISSSINSNRKEYS